MVRSGGISIVGASTGVSCAPSSASSAPVSSNRSEREGDEEERELVDRGRRSTTVPAAWTLCSSTGWLADASSELSVPGTSASSVDIREEALEADDVVPGPVRRREDEPGVDETSPVVDWGPGSGGTDGGVPVPEGDCRGVEEPEPEVGEEWPGIVDASELDTDGEPVAEVLEADPVLEDGVDVEEWPPRRLRDRETVARVCGAGTARQVVPEGAGPERGVVSVPEELEVVAVGCRGGRRGTNGVDSSCACRAMVCGPRSVRN
ncbi:hypothetical protein MRX96_018206 [Rhipicephalus microplus]